MRLLRFILWTSSILGLIILSIRGVSTTALIFLGFPLFILLVYIEGYLNRPKNFSFIDPKLYELAKKQIQED